MPMFQYAEDETNEEIEVEIDGEETNASDDATAATAAADDNSDQNAQDQIALAPNTDEGDGSSNEPKQKYSDEDKEQYSKRVRKRIDKLTFEREEAINYARQVQAQMQQMQQQQAQQATAAESKLLDEYANRIDAELAAAEKNYKEAFDSGDSELIVKANKELAGLAAEKENIRYRRPAPVQQQFQQQQQPQMPQQFQQPQMSQQFQQPVAPAQPDERAIEWAEQNKWFGEDRAMTDAALGHHRYLVADKGVRPNSVEYYDELDNYMQTNFPQKFDNQSNNGDTQDNGVVQTVTPTGRGGSSGSKTRRKVKLSPGQVAMAKRLGVPLQEYAKYAQER